MNRLKKKIKVKINMLITSQMKVENEIMNK